MYETPATLAALLAFLRSQSDQYHSVLLNTQDPDFAFAVDDPRDGSDRVIYQPSYHVTSLAGLGLMYRVIDVPALITLLGATDFNGLEATVRIVLADSLLPENAGAYAVRFRAGLLELVATTRRTDFDFALDVADFSALVLGAVLFRSLVDYGRVTLTDQTCCERLNAAFATDPPRCFMRF